jgi:hypothetical protein
MNFVAKFDSTAIYPAVITDYNHAYDANKLWGFSEGFNNQYNSARIGWRWLNGQLQLLAYVYVKGTLLRDPISYDPPIIKSGTNRKRGQLQHCLYLVPNTFLLLMELRCKLQEARRPAATVAISNIHILVAI